MALQLSLNVAGLQDAQVGPDVQKIGVSFRSFPPEPVVINSVMPETWGQGRFQGGEEVVAVNGIDVATMDRDAFREALQVRPLTIRFRVPAQDQLDSVVAEKGVEKIGLVFQQLPPAPVIVSKVQEGSWAAQQGFEGGEEIVMVNGKELSQMSADDFKKALKEERPLALRFRPRELPDGVEELVAEKEVGKIGLSFLKMPPEPVIVNKVIPGCWAEEVGFQGGEEIVALDGAPVASMTPETFKAALQQRPLRLRFRPAGHKEQEEQEEEEEDDEEPVEVTADAKVKKIGLSFRELPPQPVVVSKVVPETWASQMGFRGGEEIVALNGQPCEAMNSATFKELLGIRPLTLRYFPPLEAEPAEPEEPAELHEREAAATKIQALHRGKTARAAVAAQKEERINAATKIQAVQRGNRERKAVAEDKSRRAASIAPESPATPQTPATAARPRPPAAPPAIPRPPATPSPKKKKRQDPVRPNVPDLDVQKREEAAKRIQAVQRGKAARTATAVERQQREDAATKIQAVQRGKAARRATADEKQHREEAAKKIQAVQRGKAAQDAATKIQAVQRGKAARLAAEKDLTAPRKQSPVKQDVSDLDAQEREEAAKKIQAVHRGKAARRATADEKQQREDAAKKIQAVQRGKAAQSAAAKPRIKPEKALKAPMKEERGKKTAPAEPRKQAPGKQDVTDLDAQEREEAAKKIQAVQRGKAARTAMAEEKQQREAAATKIQAVQRGKAARMAGTDKKTESKETSGSRRSREKGPGSVGPSEASGARGTKGDEPKGRGKGTPGPDRRSVQSVRSTRSASAGASHSSQRAQARKEKAEAKEAKKAQDAAAAAAAAEPGSVTPSAEPRSPRSPRSPGSTATRRAGSEGSARSGSNSPVHGAVISGDLLARVGVLTGQGLQQQSSESLGVPVGKAVTLERKSGVGVTLPTAMGFDEQHPGDLRQRGSLLSTVSGEVGESKPPRVDGSSADGRSDLGRLTESDTEKHEDYGFGYDHSVLLRSDGSAVACGWNRYGQCDIPPLEEGVCYTQVSAGIAYSVLLRSDGSAFACGMNDDGQCDIPLLEEGMCYTQVSAGGHSVLLRSDGSAVACGWNDDGQCDIPPLEEGMCYTQVSAGNQHSVLLRSDGSAVACGCNRYGQCDIPPLEDGMCYTQISAGASHSVHLRSDGSAVACGWNRYGQCDIPLLEEGMCYTQVSAGIAHSVLLRSDGTAVACGMNDDGQCDIPPLEEGTCYTQVSAGGYHSVLLRSDGSAVACGLDHEGQCNIPVFATGSYLFHRGKDYILQVGVAFEDDGAVLTCWDLAGHKALLLRGKASDLAWETHKRIASDLRVSLPNLRVVLPDGQLLASICRATPLATLADLSAGQ
ncbi:unnamed protein product [Durusdinium trenchii]|uniref:PDZ domain-containing protein n=1 Tax=Durusdinium trenchii TaxID=1381693 RepID=A0ABP0JGQ6_9DINO